MSLFTVGTRPEDDRSNWRSSRIKDVTSFVNRGIAPHYADEEAPAAADEDPAIIAFNQKCIRPDRSVDASLGRPVVWDESLLGSEARLWPDDVVVNSTGTGTLGRAGLVSASDIAAGQVLIADGHVTVVRADKSVVMPSYLSYLLATDDFYRVANSCLAVGSTNQMELGREQLRRLGISLPQLDEQQAIVRFLDSETRRIDDLMSEQSGHQSSLQEESFRSELVSAFLIKEPHPGWVESRLKYVFEPEWNGVWGNEPDGGKDDVLCIRVADFDRFSFTAGSTSVTMRSVPEFQRLPRLLRPGDVLLEKSGGSGDKPVGCAVRFVLDRAAVCSNFIAVLRPTSDYDLDWAGLLMAAHYQARVNTPFVKQTTGIQNLDSGRYLGLRVWAPPRGEQREIARRIERTRDLVERRLSELRRQSQLLAEHRDALIAAALTNGLESKRRAA